MSYRSAAKLYCFEAPIVANIPVSMIMPKSIGISARINQIILRCVEAGLIKKWSLENEISLKKENFVQSAIQLETFYGVFVPIIGFWILSLASFITEISLYKYLRSARDHNKFFVFLESFIFTNELYFEINREQ